MMENDWNTDFDDEADLAEDEDLFSDAASGTEQVHFVEDFESDLGSEGPSQNSEQGNKPKDNTEASRTAPITGKGASQPKRSDQESKRMSNFDDVIAKSVSSVPECLAGGVIDMDSGMLLGVKTVDSHPQEVLDMLAAATQDLFQGQNVVTIENMFKKARGLEMDDFHYFKEIIINSENLIHIFMRGKQNPQYVITFVCRLSANLGMVLTKARAQVPLLEAAI